MATYHVCDICGQELPFDEDQQAYVLIGCRRTDRTINSDCDDLMHRDLECCFNCANKVSGYIAELRVNR